MKRGRRFDARTPSVPAPPRPSSSAPAYPLHEGKTTKNPKQLKPTRAPDRPTYPTVPRHQGALPTVATRRPKAGKRATAPTHTLPANHATPRSSGGSLGWTQSQPSCASTGAHTGRGHNLPRTNGSPRRGKPPHANGMSPRRYDVRTAQQRRRKRRNIISCRRDAARGARTEYCTTTRTRWRDPSEPERAGKSGEDTTKERETGTHRHAPADRRPATETPPPAGCTTTLIY